MPQFIYFLKPARTGLTSTMTPEEEAVVEEHFKYLQEKLQKGELYLAGRTLDEEPFGIAIFQAESQEAARDFMVNDPAVKNHVMTAELHTYRIALIKDKP
jgi:uncharacterized protein YciI